METRCLSQGKSKVKLLQAEGTREVKYLSFIPNLSLLCVCVRQLNQRIPFIILTNAVLRRIVIRITNLTLRHQNHILIIRPESYFLKVQLSFE